MIIDKHISKSITRKAIKSIFPPSMYQKYGREQKSNSRSKKRANNKTKAPLPPVREYKTAQKAQRSKTLREIESVINQRKTETSVGKNRKESAGKTKRQSNFSKQKPNSRGRQMSENKTKLNLQKKEQANHLINKARHMSASKPEKRLKSGSKSRSRSKGKRRRATDYKPLQIVNKIDTKEGIEQPLPELQYNYTKGSAIPLYPKKLNYQYETAKPKKGVKERALSKIINIECQSNELVQTPKSKNTNKDDNGNNGSRSGSGTIMDTTATKRRNPSSPNSQDITNSKCSSISDHDREIKSNSIQNQRNINTEKINDEVKMEEIKSRYQKNSIPPQAAQSTSIGLNQKKTSQTAELLFENRASEDMFDKSNDLSSPDINANNIDDLDDFDDFTLKNKVENEDVGYSKQIKNDDSFDMKRELEEINKEDK